MLAQVGGGGGGDTAGASNIGEQQDLGERMLSRKNSKEVIHFHTAAVFRNDIWRMTWVSEERVPFNSKT